MSTTHLDIVGSIHQLDQASAATRAPGVIQQALQADPPPGPGLLNEAPLIGAEGSLNCLVEAQPSVFDFVQCKCPSTQLLSLVLLGGSCCEVLDGAPGCYGQLQPCLSGRMTVQRRLL